MPSINNSPFCIHTAAFNNWQNISLHAFSRDIRSSSCIFRCDFIYFIEKNYSDERRPPQKAIRTKSVLQNGTNEKARENPGFFASFGVT